MFVRVKRSIHNYATYEYIQIVESFRDAGKPRQRVLATLGRRDELIASGQLDDLIKSMAKFSEKLRVVQAVRTEGIVFDVRIVALGTVLNQHKSVGCFAPRHRFVWIAMAVAVRVQEEDAAVLRVCAVYWTPRIAGRSRRSVTRPLASSRVAKRQ